MATYDPYGYNARDALLRQMNMPRQDFPNLGTPVPVASTLPVPKPPGALPTQLAPSGSGPSGVTDPAKYAAINFDALGNRDYLNNRPGGAAWDQINGSAPAGWTWNANGQPMKTPLGTKLDNVMSDAVVGGMTGGIGAASMAPTIAGSVAGNFITAKKPDGYQPAQGLVGAGDTGATATQGTAGTTQGATASGGLTLPDNVDTNGFAKPGYAVQGAPQAMPGWDQTKWADPAHQSPKYVVGRILSQYPQTTDGLKQAMGEIQKAYPGAQQTGEDTLSIPGVSTSVDVVKAGGGFWWGPETDANGNPYPKGASGDAASGGDSSGGYNAGGDVATSDVIAKIVARLGAMAGGQGQGAGVMSARDALLQQFGAT
jgi:hypothetical protein